jgi:hypothetical protein
MKTRLLIYTAICAVVLFVVVGCDHNDFFKSPARITPLEGVKDADNPEGISNELGTMEGAGVGL